MDITVRTLCNVHNLVAQIVSKVSRDELMDLIRYIDTDLVEDIDFTKSMYEYFKSELQKEGEL